MRRKDEALRETLLKTARELIAEHGPEAINTRRLADGACVATGTVYNYFSGKEDVLFTLAEAYWKDAFRAMTTKLNAPDFVGQVGQIYGMIRARMDDDVGSLMRSLRGASPEGRARMMRTQYLLSDPLTRLIEADTRIRPEVWSEALTRESLADYVVMNLFAYLSHRAESVPVLMDILRRVLYAPEGGRADGTGNL